MTTFREIFCRAIFFGCIISFVSCMDKTEPADTSSFGYDFYPVRVGSYRVYQSDSIVLRSAGTIRDTLHGFIKEEMDNFFITGNGDTVYTLKIYFKRLPTDTFVYQKSTFIRKDKNKVTRQEDNLEFTKMVFPIQKGVRFNHNQYFDARIDVEIGGEIFLAMYDGWNTRYESTNTPLDWNGSKVDNVVVRLVDDSGTTLEKKYYYETYIKGVGLYSQEMVFLQDNKGGTIPLEERATKGFYHNRVLLEYHP